MIDSKISKIIMQQEIIYADLLKQNTIQNQNYQNITYFMNTPDKWISPKEERLIDFLHAMSEMDNLDFNFEDNFIGFLNNKTNECLQFRRKKIDYWYAESVINHGKNWDGYAWTAYSKTDKITDMLRLFFEEVPWFGMLSWKMRRYKHE